MAQAESYDLYLWEEGEEEPEVPVASDLADPFYQPPGGLAPGVVYHWRVDAAAAA